MDPRIAPDLSALARLQHEARGFSFLNRQPVHSLLSGRRASRVRGRGLAFEEIRSYRPGDDIRHIDWRASARTGDTQTRVFTEERDRPTLLVVDLTAAMFFGSVHATKSAIAAEVAALCCWRGLRAGDRLGALVFGDDGVTEFRAHRSRAAVMRILGEVSRRAEALAAAPPRPAGPSALNAALRRAEELVTHDAMVVVIADIQAADEAAARSLGRIARHNDVIAVPISDPLERALPEAPWAVVDAYWSVILVTVPDYRVAPNALNRFNFNNHSPLAREADGSLKLAIGPRPVAAVPESNWLPSPEGKPFSLIFRTYVPKEVVRRGEWQPAPVTRLP
nr:DUF58 domain-containing protein [uncultured Roseococcus sp.]